MVNSDRIDSNILKFITKNSLYGLAALVCMPMLAGCQYFTFYNKVTDPNWANADTSPEAECEAMGATRGFSQLDWCTARREADLKRAAPPAGNTQVIYHWGILDNTPLADW